MIRKILILVPISLVALVLFKTQNTAATGEFEVQQFLDTTRKTAFSAHTDPIDPNYGQFSFSISGVGTYIGGNQQSIHQLRSGAILIHFKGDVQFLSQADGTNPDTSKHVKLYALVGRREGHSSAILKDHSGYRPHYYLMLSHVPRSTAKKVVTKVASSVEGGDWETLYDLTSSTFTSNTTKEEFITSLLAQEAEVGRVVNVEILSEPDSQLSPLGTWFFTVQTRVTFDVNGILETDEFIDTYVLEDGQWKFWFSVAN